MFPPIDRLVDQPVEVRSAVVAVLCWVMGADGELRPEERTAVADTARRLSIPVPSASQVPSWSESWPPLLTPVGCSVLLLAALLATADGELAPPEEQCLALLADALGLAPTVPATMTAWAQQGHRWMRQGVALCS
ncbi:MAG: hypothetical protein GXP62_06930 [Oligoflexia bacterium]|nr:hypothetical protein [Oligoflexia bacterium]